VTSLVGDVYVDFCRGIRELCGVDLLQYKRGQMERRIREFASRRGVVALPEYLTLLRRTPDELERFLDRMTINVSQLWRNPEQWSQLALRVLPELAERGTIRILSAGCSYGAEAYTVAALCRETVPKARVSVEGVDIDRRVLARAEEGRFSDDDARDAPREALDRWFEREDSQWRANAELRSLVRFRFGDLLRATFAPASYDLVLCRNTVIYFADDARDAVHARLAEALRPGGYLMVGSTERVGSPRTLGLEIAFSFVYRKAG
jgi:chemotaxis protein methyltransferase CheR